MTKKFDGFPSSGIIRYFDIKTGCGSIIRNSDGADISISKFDVSASSMTSIRRGQKVDFKCISRGGRLYAIALRQRNPKKASVSPVSSKSLPATQRTIPTPSKRWSSIQQKHAAIAKTTGTSSIPDSGEDLQQFLRELDRDVRREIKAGYAADDLRF